MATITWRNINAPNFGDAINATAQAGRSIGSGIGQLQQSLQGFNDNAQNKQNDLVKSNTDAVMARLQGINSLDQYNEAKNSGLLSQEALESQFGKGNVDTGSILSQFGQLDNRLRQDLVEEQNFESSQNQRQLQQQEQPIRRQVDLLKAQGKHQEAAQLASGLSDAGNQLRGIENQRRTDEAYAEASTAKQRKQATNSLISELTEKSQFTDFGEVRDEAATRLRANGIPENEITNALQQLRESADNQNMVSKEEQRAIAKSDSLLSDVLINAQSDYKNLSKEIKLDEEFSAKQESLSEQDVYNTVREVVPNGTEITVFGDIGESALRDQMQNYLTQPHKYKRNAVGDIVGFEPANEQDLAQGNQDLVEFKPWQLVNAMKNAVNPGGWFSGSNIIEDDLTTNLIKEVTNKENEVRRAKIEEASNNLRQLSTLVKSSLGEKDGKNKLSEFLTGNN